MRYFNLLFCLLSVLISCQEVANQSFVNGIPTLVIEGKITNKPGPYLVRINLSTDFDSEEANRPVSDASVRIFDNLGNLDTLTLVEPGIFQTSSIQGAINVNYTLEVNYEEIIYAASSLLGPIGTIDSLVSTYRPETITIDDGYYVSLYGQNSVANQINYYRWIVYKNGEVFNGRDFLFVFSDEFVTEINDLEFIIPFEIGDSATWEMESLDKDVYDYFIHLNGIINNDGFVSRSNYTNPPSNFTPTVLGVFQASAVGTQSIIIAE